jgi:uncharacterized Zn finger protein
MQPNASRSKRTKKQAEPVLLRRRSDGQVEALSSDGERIYTVRLGADLHCQCPGFTHHGHCKHIAAATARYAAMWTPPAQPQPVSLRTTRATADMLYSDGPEAA